VEELLVFDVAVIIVNYNSYKFLVRCLQALEKQTVKPRKIIVVDNGGVEKLPQQFEQDYPTITLIRSIENLGFAAANNFAVKTIEDCEWIALLNPDAFPESDWLASLQRATQQFPEYTLFGCHMVCADNPAILDGTGDIYHVSGRAWRRGHGLIAPKKKSGPEEIFAPCAAAALYRRDVFTAARGFDENYFCYFEDVDLGFRLRLLGHRCLYVPDAVVHHVGSAVTKKHSDFYVYHGHRNLVWTYFKNMPGILFWLYLPLHIALNFFSLFKFILNGQSKVIFKAKKDALKKLGYIWRQRREIQQQRVVDVWQLRRLMARGLPLRSKTSD
jgi:GT2 family glycosyltransferase